jgi:hypothetical protein
MKCILMVLLPQIPYRVQHIMCKEGMPILLGAIPAFEMFMTKWEQLSIKHPHL